MFYAASTRGFYKTEIHGSGIPSDAVEITDAYWHELLDGQSNGKVILPDGVGYPVLRDPEPVVLEPLTPEQKLTAAGLTVDELKSLLGIN